MTELNMNSRLLRSSEEGFFNQGQRTEICRSCGVHDMCGRAKTRKVCADFAPILTFRSPLIGLDGWSNTFRLSSLWYDRLKGRIGHTLAYYDTKGPKLIGHARLTGIARGPMNLMLNLYAHSNHLCIGAGVSKEDAPEWLREKLNKNYKTMFKEGDGRDIMTVIFSVRMRAANPEEGSEKMLGRKEVRGHRSAA